MKRTGIERLLPEVFRATIAQDNPLSDLLDVMARLHAPSEAILDELHDHFDPTLAHDRFVPLLSRWVDLERLFVPSAVGLATVSLQEPISTGMGRLRELVARAAFLSQWRGTARGLVAFLETATGARGFRIEEQVVDQAGEVRPFHVRVLVPDEAAGHRMLIERIIEFEKPAHVTYDLEITSRS